MPPHALDGGGERPFAAGLSPAAWSRIVWVDGPVCDGCGAPFAYDLRSRCAACTARPRAFDRARAACVYDEDSRGLILKLKHGDRTDLARLFALWLHRSAAALLEDCDAVVPVPMHPSRLFKRRYNQAAEIARPLARLAHRRYLPDALIRARDTGGQGVGGDAADDLHQLHQRHRVHEVQADELLRPCGRGRQPGDRDRGGVGRQQRVLAQMVGEVAEDRLLDLLVLGGRLDHEVGGADLGGVRPGADARQRLLHLLHRHHAARDLAGEVLLDQFPAGGDALGRDVVPDDVVARQSADMRYAGAHLPGADHADRLDFSHSVRGSPCAPTFAGRFI